MVIRNALDSLYADWERYRSFLGKHGLRSIILRSTGTLVTSSSQDVPESAKQYSRKIKIEVPPTSPVEEEKVICVMIGPEERHMAARNISQNLAIEARKEVEKSFEDIVPKAYHHFRSVLLRNPSTNYLQNDHGIMRLKLKDGSKPHAGKILQI